jgi:hypothetical protein
MPAGMAVATAVTAVLPPRAVAVAMKTAVTGIAGAQTTNNNQQSTKSSTATETETVTMTWMTMTMEMEAKMVAGGSGNSGGSTGAVASLAAAVAAWQERGVGGGGSVAAA